MTKSKIILMYWLVVLLVLPLSVWGEVSLPQAVDLGRNNLAGLMQQSQHYRLDYDTVVALPVHSEVTGKGDFYLLYFIHKKQFQMEMEIDRQTGQFTVLAVKKMSMPYAERPDRTFNYRYFCPDSLLKRGAYQARPGQDSTRLVYLGLMPVLGKRGVAWQRFSGGKVAYISLDGSLFSAEDIAREKDSTSRVLSPR